MKKYLTIHLLAAVLLISCNELKVKESNSIGVNGYPTIILEPTKDNTLQIGDLYKCKIYLSDTSLYYVTDLKGHKRRTKPVFRINGEIVESNGDYYEYSEIVKDTIIYKEFPNAREWTVGIIIANPNPLSGDIEFHIRANYTIK